MPSRYYRRVFIPGYYYHIYNRGANKKRIFKDAQDYETFIEILSYYLNYPNGKPRSVLQLLKVPNLINANNTVKTSINLTAYCLMSNHFHFIIKQVDSPAAENGITNLMRRLTITYALYAKSKYSRSGTLFESKYKNILVRSEQQLVHLSKYIHRNPIEILKGSEPLESYKYSSYPSYLGYSPTSSWLSANNILILFSKSEPGKSYKNFVEEIPLNERIIEKVTLE